MRPITGFLATCCTLVPALAIMAVEEAPPEDEGPWTYGGRVGVFFTSVLAENANTSRDTSISGTEQSVSYLLSASGELHYLSGPHAIDQTLELNLGRQRTEGQEWTENVDEILYDGIYTYDLGDPSELYGSWGLETVFTGPDPDNNPFDPTLAKVAAGYRQHYPNVLTDPDEFSWRVGVRAQKRWGSALGDEGREIETGVELVLRYEGEYDDYVDWFIQYEGFSEFQDIGHITNLITAGLVIDVGEYVDIELRFRAYYETSPDDAPDDAVGLDEWSMRQETLVGITYEF